MGDERTYIYKEIRLTFEEFGTGPEVLLAFHGFGQRSSVFNDLGTVLGERFRIFSFNLFFHGSFWPHPGLPIDPDFLNKLFESFLIDHRINRFSLIAYSIGAKLGLVLAGKMPDRTKDLILIAPEGIKLNFWYRFATESWLTRRLFRITLNNPEFLLFLSKWAVKFRLIHPSTSRFVFSQLGNREKQKKIYYTWTVMRKLKISPKHLAGILNHHHVRSMVFLGEKDKIITKTHVEALTNHLNQIELIFLPVEHQHLIGGVKAWILEHPGSL